MKKCPYCAEEIQDEAIVCRFCGRDLAPKVEPAPVPVPLAPKKKSSNSAFLFVLGLTVVGLCFCILLLIFINNNKYFYKEPSSSVQQIAPTESPLESAWTACTMFIEQQLGLSMRDAQRYTPSGVTALAGDEYKVKVYYANQGSTYLCDILHRSDGNWQLLGLEVR